MTTKTKTITPEAEAITGQVITNGAGTPVALRVVSAKADTLPELTADLITPSITFGTPEKRLGAIAKAVRKEFGKTIDGMFAIGHLLTEARDLFAGDTEYGRWLNEQAFPFTTRTAHYLRTAAGQEDEVRALIAEQSDGGRDIGVVTAVKELTSTATTTGRASAVDEDRPEPEVPTDGTNTWYPAWRDTFMRWGDLRDLTVEELGEFAGLMQSLAVDYKEEKARRQGGLVMVDA